ncbi:hypothetical protein B0T16DRAFT_427611 [Cercophora newfieldiana]|uniref:DUF3626 domain-containing protein n=1 Tax=Cercophora newfieldiana TaxID=92897 RepID=A0AA39YA33_9PEZI|nr:hypothetical protein B0T16DRAFT_427611 [Cercophora newfieldiana]
MDTPLHPSQAAAIAHIRTAALTLRPQSLEMINHVLYMSNALPASATHTALLASIRRTARVALHFHPDRPVGDHPSVTAALLADGIYRSQFETGISNGGLSARPGGARDEWERGLFGGGYHGQGFGSSWFVLKGEVLPRCTFTFGGSADEPKWKGTMDEFDGVLAGALEDAFIRESGEKIRTGNLDYYVEAQVHGEVRLDRDVEALVADPSFRDTEVGVEMAALAERFGFPLQWHVGSEIKIEEVPHDFRGPTVRSLSERVAKDGMVTAKAIGDAVRELARDPAAWSERGSQAHVLQELKWLWHVLVRYGKPSEPIA